MFGNNGDTHIGNYNIEDGKAPPQNTEENPFTKSEEDGSLGFLSHEEASPARADDQMSKCGQGIENYIRKTNKLWFLTSLLVLRLMCPARADDQSVLPYEYNGGEFTLDYQFVSEGKLDNIGFLLKT